MKYLSPSIQIMAELQYQLVYRRIKEDAVRIQLFVREMSQCFAQRNSLITET
jgi:hypothetical protein